MGVSQVNTNNINIVQLALAKKGIKGTRKTQMPEYLTRSGSIFKAPGANPSQLLAETNTRYTISDLQGRRAPINTRGTGAPLPAPKPKSSDDNSEPDVSVSGGKAAIASAETSQGQAEEATKRSEQGTKAANKFADLAADLRSRTTKDEKSFLAAYKAQESAVKRDNAKILKIIKENEEHERQINDWQRELESLNANNGSDNNNNPGRAAELRGLIGAKVGLMQSNGKAIYSLQRSQSRSLSKMNRVQIKYLKAQQKSAKQVDAQQNETSDIIKIAQEAEKYSALAQSGGQALGLLGKLFVAIGSSTSGFFGIGAALVTIGTVMQKVGAVVELVGQYGQAAANITKTAAYAAEGNLMGAAMSLGSAISSATACVKGTKGLKGEFGKINDQAEAATQKIAAKSAAKEAVKGMSEEQLDGMSKKEARKYIQADLQKQMKDGKINTDGLGVNGIKEQIKNANGENVGINSAITNAKTAYKNAQNTAQESLNIASLTKNESGRYVTNTMKKDGITAKTVSQGKLDRTVKKQFKQSIADIGAPKLNIDWGGNIVAIGNSVTNIATVLSTNDSLNTYSGGKKKPLPPAQLDARTQRIMMKNQRYRAIRNYAA